MYPTEFVPDPDQVPQDPPSLSSAIRDVVNAATDLMKNEAVLARAEIMESAEVTREFVRQAFVSGTLIMLGVIPFLAFLILLLGQWLDGRYWLSSLLVSLLFAGGGFLLYMRAKKQLENRPGLKATRHNLESAADAVQTKLAYLKSTTFGGANGHSGIQ